MTKKNGELILEMHTNIAVLMTKVEDIKEDQGEIKKTQACLTKSVNQIKQTLVKGSGKIKANREIIEGHRANHKYITGIIFAVAGAIGGLIAWLVSILTGK